VPERKLSNCLFIQHITDIFGSEYFDILRQNQQISIKVNQKSMSFENIRFEI